MISVYFYNITKRLNSTAIPTGSGTDLECVYKESTSILNPVLKLQLSTKPDYNYFKIDDRYYWITDIISLRDDLWQISGRIDVLATYKGHISNTSAFVLYDSTANTQLPDTRLGIKTDCDTYTATASMPWQFSGGNGTYLIATTGESDSFDFQTFQRVSDARAGTGVYIIPQSSISQLGFDTSDMTTQMQRFQNQWNEDSDNDLAIMNTSSTDFLECLWYTIKGGALLFSDFFKLGFNALKLFAQNLIAGGNALQNIKASYWIPFVVPATAYEGVTKQLALGSYADTITGLCRVTDPVISIGTFVAIPWHYNDWRNVSCTELMLYVPMVGCINIPPEVVKGQNQLDVKFSVNLYSGAMAVQVSCNGAPIGTYGADTAMPFLIGDSNLNMGGVVNTLIAGATSNILGVVDGLSQTLTPMVTSVGGIGGGAGTELTREIVCVCRCHDTTQEPSNLIGTIGTPTRELKTLSGSGFCQCMNAQMSGAAVTGEPDPTQPEIEQVNNYLNTGVYLE